VAAPLKLKRQITAQKLKLNSAVADQYPVASVLVDTPVSHLEGIYDYLVPLHLEESAIYGTKVVVPFGKTQVDGLIVGRKNKSDQIHKLKMIIDVSVAHSGIFLNLPCRLGLQKRIKLLRILSHLQFLKLMRVHNFEI
jgi:hypothetical protein